MGADWTPDSSASPKKPWERDVEELRERLDALDLTLGDHSSQHASSGSDPLRGSDIGDWLDRRRTESPLFTIPRGFPLSGVTPANASGNLTAHLCYATKTQAGLGKLRWRTGNAGSGAEYRFGVYDGSWNLLASTSPIVAPPANQTREDPINVPIDVELDLAYYIAIGLVWSGTPTLQGIVLGTGTFTLLPSEYDGRAMNRTLNVGYSAGAALPNLFVPSVNSSLAAIPYVELIP